MRGIRANRAKGFPKFSDILTALNLEALVVYVVAYDLKSPHDTGDDYDRVIDAVKAAGTTWCHLEKSVWLIASDETASDIRDALKRYLNEEDLLFVARLFGNWASFNMGSRRTDWLKHRTF